MEYGVVQAIVNLFRRGSKFKKLSQTHPGEFSVSTAAVPKSISDKDVTIEVKSGAIWVDVWGGTAIANTTCKKITGIVDLHIDSSISIISDSTGATVQLWVWED